MHRDLESKLDQIKALCLTHNVRSLHLFGSAASEEFDASRSDFDFLVEFLPMIPRQRADANCGLLEDVRILLGRDVDLIVGSAIRNPYLLRSVNDTKVPLHAAA